MIRDNLYVIAGVLKDTAAFVDDPLARDEVGKAIYLIHKAIRHMKQSDRLRTPDDIAEKRRIDEVLQGMEQDRAALNRHGIRMLSNDQIRQS